MLDLRVAAITTILTAALGALAQPAEAGRSDFAWVYGVEAQPERGAELETWLLELDSLGDEHIDETLWWFGPVVGITDQLELAIPVEMTWTRSDSLPIATQLARVGAELRYRFVTSDPVDAPTLVPAIRVGVKRLSSERDAVRTDADAILGWQGCLVHIAANAGISWVARDSSSVEDTVVARGALGVSVRVSDEVRLGVEGVTELTLKNDAVYDWAAVGPNVAWTHGRFWLAAGVPIGVYEVDLAPRITWGLAF